MQTIIIATQFILAVIVWVLGVYVVINNIREAK